MGETLRVTGSECESWVERTPRAVVQGCELGEEGAGGPEPARKGLRGVESYEEASWSRAGIGALCGRSSRWEWSERRGFKGKSPLGTGKSPNSRAGVRAEEQKILEDQRK